MSLTTGNYKSEIYSTQPSHKNKSELLLNKKGKVRKAFWSLVWNFEQT